MNLEKSREDIRVAEPNHKECQKGGESSIKYSGSSAAECFPCLSLSGFIGTAYVCDSHVGTVVDGQAHADYHDDCNGDVHRQSHEIGISSNIANSEGYTAEAHEHHLDVWQKQYCHHSYGAEIYGQVSNQLGRHQLKQNLRH